MDKNALMALMAAKKAGMKQMEKTVKLQPGDTRIRLLPSWRGDADPTWWHDFGQHFIKDAAGKIQAVYLCTAATFEGRACEVCNTLAAAGRAAADDLISETLAEAKASRTVLINALMLDSKTPNKPEILEIKRSLFEQLVDISLEYEGQPLDLDTGMVIKCTRDGKGLNTKYTAMPTAKVHPIDRAVLSQLNNLDDYVKQEGEEQLRRAIGAVNSVAGLSAPGTGDRPATSPSRIAGPAAGPADIIDDDAVPLTPAQKRAAAAGGATTTAAAPASTLPALDDELDAMLSDLPELD